MAIADRLFNVSIQEKGVSKLLAMDSSAETEPAPMQHTAFHQLI